MAFLLNFQVQGVSGKNEQSTQTPWRGAPEVRGPMQLHRLKAGPADVDGAGICVRIVCSLSVCLIVSFGLFEVVRDSFMTR